MVKIVAEYVCHPRQFKSSVQTCMKEFPRNFTIYGSSHLLLMQSGNSRILVISTTINIVIGHRSFDLCSSSEDELSDTEEDYGRYVTVYK